MKDWFGALVIAGSLAALAWCAGEVLAHYNSIHYVEFKVK